MTKLHFLGRIIAITLFAIALTPVSATIANPKLSHALQSKLAHDQNSESLIVFVYFKDKGDQIDKKIRLAKAALTTKALNRRMINRGADNIISWTDLPLHQDYVNQVAAHTIKVRHQLNLLNAVSIETSNKSLERIAAMPFVERIELVNRVKRAPQPEVLLFQDEPFPMEYLKSLAPTALDYGSSLVQNQQVNVPAVHELGLSGSNVVIAVFDSGFNRLSHESFNQMNIAGTWDFVNNDADVGDGTDNGTGTHGTNTLSAVGGYSPGNLIGPAFGATYYLAKTENTESELHVEEDNWCAAAQWADANGAQIITSSLGYTNFDSGIDYQPSDMDGETTIITRCADAVADNGIVVINSAGNNGAGSGENTLGAPSDGNFVLAVGAVTSTGSRSSFSSVGPSADGRVKPDVMAMGSRVRVAGSASDSAYRNVNGTSFSCPITAGVAALVLEANPNLSAAQVRDILRNTADRAANPDERFGFGIIDALAAVKAAQEGFAPLAAFDVQTDASTTVQFTNRSSDVDGVIVSYLWSFGDGLTSSLENPNHTFASPGNYTVSLIVTDNDGLSTEQQQEVRVPMLATKIVGNEAVFSNISTAANRRAMPFTMPEDGRINSVSIYHEGGTGSVLLAVYDGEETPTNRIGITAVSVISEKSGWQTVNLETPVTIPEGRTLWLAWVFENNPGIRYIEGAPGRMDAGSGWNSSMPVSYGEATQRDFIYSVYANYETVTAEPPECDVEEGFESGSAGWINDALSSCATGSFVAAPPTLVTNYNVTTQVSAAKEGVNALFTAVNSSAGQDDVDGGVCVVNSPIYSVTQDSMLSLSYFHGQRDAGDDSDDFFELLISNDGGLNFTSLVRIGDETTNANWTQLTQSVFTGDNVQLRLRVSDGPSEGDLIEAGIDDLSICRAK